MKRKITSNATFVMLVFYIKVNFNRHVISVHEKKYNFCDASFSQNVHIASVHERKKSVKYIICDTSFGGKNKLNKRIAPVHEEKMPFKCNFCVKSFAHKSNLIDILNQFMKRRSLSNVALARSFLLEKW